MATTRHKGRTEGQAGGNVYSIFSQRSQLGAVMGTELAVLEGCHRKRGRREGAKVIGEFVLR